MAARMLSVLVEHLDTKDEESKLDRERAQTMEY